MKHNLSYDLVVVGTGFASSFFLHKLHKENKLPKRVLVLERGQIISNDQKRNEIREGKRNSGINYKESNQSVVNKNPDKPWIFDPNFGGSSNCWTGCTPRFMPNDFQLKTKYGRGVDWPLTYDELEPYYGEAENVMAISGPGTTPFPKSTKYPLKPHALTTFDTLLAKRYNELYISQPSARASERTGNRNVCCSSSVCDLCPVDAKFTIDNGLKYLYNLENVDFQIGAEVRSLQTEGGRVTGVEYRLNGEDHVVISDLVVLGANAIFNANILLNSGDSNPFVGKGLTEQFGLYGYFYLDDFENVGGSSIITANGYMLYETNERSNYAACLIESHNGPYVRGEVGKWRQIAKYKFVFEEIPDDKNGILLNTDNPYKPIIHFEGPSKYVLDAQENLSKNVDKIFNGFPIEKYELDSHFQKSEYHICSTTRMSDSGNNGVVGKNLFHHGYNNLIVMGSSVFPTISPSNPTLTLSALSLMAADKL